MAEEPSTSDEKPKSFTSSALLEVVLFRLHVLAVHAGTAQRSTNIGGQIDHVLSKEERKAI